MKIILNGYSLPNNSIIHLEDGKRFVNEYKIFRRPDEFNLRRSRNLHIYLSEENQRYKTEHFFKVANFTYLQNLGTNGKIKNITEEKKNKRNVTQILQITKQLHGTEGYIRKIHNFLKYIMQKYKCGHIFKIFESIC